MKLITLDFETYWDVNHTLSKMSPIEYVMHPETELISCAIKTGKRSSYVVFGEDEIARALADEPIEDSLVIAHNMSMFDSMIVAWRLKLKPRMWGCTLAMSRYFHGNTIGGRLATLVQHYGIGVKNNQVLIQTKGKHLKDFTPQERADMEVYNRDDTDQCYDLFLRMYPHMPRRELHIIDSNVRMLVEPKFHLNFPMLQEALRREQAKKRKTLISLATQLEVDNNGDDETTARRVREVLMSAEKFSVLLAQRGVPVPVKPSPSDPEKLIPALAKTDDEFMALLEDDDPVVAAAAAARLEQKSTLLETRLQAFIRTGKVTGGTLPIPARFYGAHTGRDSGELYNALNMPRIVWNKDGTPVPKLTNALRMSLEAPKGYVVIVADKSGIEMRLNHHLWKVRYSMDLWKQDPEADIYRTTAAKYYRVEESAVQGPQRQFGKVLQLACGFGIGATTFLRTAWTMGRLRLEPAEAENGVQGWRRMHPEIADWDTGGWARCHESLRYIAAGQEFQIDPWGLLHTSKIGIHGPDGRIVRYPDLRTTVNEKTGRTEWKYGQGRHTRYVYGGKVDENVIQFLGRTVLMDDQEKFWKDTGLLPALRVYDELAYVVPEKEAEALLAHLLKIMRTPPDWWPELVVWAEGDMAECYGMAK